MHCIFNADSDQDPGSALSFIFTDISTSHLRLGKVSTGEKHLKYFFEFFVCVVYLLFGNLSADRFDLIFFILNYCI